ncbi:uncharacterized protein C5orf34 homolog [Haliotis rubra]|uniref:uncharacterized protein C5orf34 homolog n=1 Tax=Haliotis rubra TaxID=36100 RepID=UPI001EE59451|nr:uncharacterized protein C5orf34 homolog [Haliotis rubra]
MSSTPSLMVLYTNDAVEVRYADGSSLQLSPCGASVLHHDRPEAGQHPVAGLRKIQQRCRYVTSAYRQKVLQALDFRNRFADRPYLCDDLLVKDDVVPLYTDIKEVAWPKTGDRSWAEHLPDGSIRIFSVDEFASLSLSQHKRDFTVCYLSKISQEPVKNKSVSSSRRSASCNSSQNKSGNDSQKLISSGTNQTLNNTSGCLKGDGSESSGVGKMAPLDAGQSGPNTETSNKSNKKTVESVDVATDKEKIKQGRVDPAYTRISTPTNFADEGDPGGGNEAVITPFGRMSMFRRYGAGSTETSPATHDISSISKISSEGLCTTIDVDVTVGHHELSLEQRSASPVLPGQSNGHNAGQLSNSVGNSTGDHSMNRNISNSSEEREKSVTSANSSAERPACRQLYTWVTRHISCNECPSRWRHPLKLAEEKSSERQMDEDNSQLTPGRLPLKIDKKHTSMSPLPQPIPLTCHAPHHHKWAPIDAHQDDLDRFNPGRLKVVMVDGIIYRLIHLPALKVMEIYPGDGSVFLSQGVSGQFYTQILPAGDKLEERTFSLTSSSSTHVRCQVLPGEGSQEACRFMCEAVQRDKLSHSEEQPCWQVTPTTVQEPLSVSILEEAYIPGVGRFTAHTNGRVRVVFDDRTSLDMVCNFSRRVEECAQHTADSQQSVNSSLPNVATVTALDNEVDSTTCRLMLPSGKYILVNKLKPGTYSKYVSQAMEWSSWVNASPLDRKHFYERLGQTVNAQGSAALELQKINCFNYIVENTVLQPAARKVGPGNSGTVDTLGSNHGYNSLESAPQYQSLTSAANSIHVQQSVMSNQFRPIMDSQTPAQPITDQLTSSSWHSTIYPHPMSNNHPSVSVHYTAPVPMTSRLSSNHIPPSMMYPGNQLHPVGSSDKRTMEMLDGFSSVRHALLQTNKLIQDIDDILDKNS